ncbi:STAS domain-containing protein [Sphingomonas quercus]|uniref:STAS domain-containing protein n=1 Tax=Sphingomonas quercus TaxID=2842451 RepID=A0ABS6BGW2_9SPHN|nr:STAS domain-containing protein [Sphingomonas quercus]MBU3076509.1 STAS domain-containing protein [Sphingomonas quercus]
MIALPTLLDTQAAGPLLADLRQSFAEPGDVRVDGGAVERVGQAAVQLLASARLSAAADARGFVIEPVSAPLLAAAKLLGVQELLWPEGEPAVVAAN